MSIIEEALRRVQDPNAAPAPAVQAPPKTPETQLEPAAHSWSTTPPSTTLPRPAQQSAPVSLWMIALAVLGLAAVWLSGSVTWMKRTLTPTPAAPAAPAPQTIASTPARPAAIVAPPVSIAPPTRHPPSPASSFVLSGVVHGAGEPYAMINNAIIGVGERIGEATVIEVGEQRVRLRLADGTETALEIPR